MRGVAPGAVHAHTDGLMQRTPNPVRELPGFMGALTDGQRNWGKVSVSPYP